ncbi:RsmD family RNA methyltransferase [Chelatococcus sp. XZ-Ab1]|uniref:class I SAM-dependent RNA methyltransferase n=1 Tax=Chelatococcus sp. XZ-Ab1 TaxID=3034027 RepID=UPI0023E4745F|nr:RsmD family RNA methyltransferase [Chelatococcus sp. XZ-Ab1]
MAETLTITRLGARGDGVAEGPRGPVYVPFALPGEVVTAEVDGERGRLVSVETASRDRQTAECPLFAHCGGCAGQHVAPQLYGAWKRDIVVQALAHAGIETDVMPLVDAHGAGRRRVTFHARLIEGKAAVGFMAARSHALVPIAQCPVLAPGLAAAPEKARALAALLLPRGKPLDIQATETLGGLDIDIRGLGKADDRLSMALVEAARTLDLARLSLHGEILIERRPPAVAMGPAAVVPPPGGFLQATAAGEAALAALVTEACAGARHVADLFAGCGPFALRLARQAKVHAVENGADALAALQRALRNTQGLKPVTTEARDLFRRPLLPLELERFDAVVLDPPRAGAEAQARQIALSRVPLAVSVSCDPGTFARDARILVEAGMHLTRVVPVDQFRYTHHVEVVGVFTRPAKQKHKNKGKGGRP